VSNAKLEATGWAPQHGLDAGIQELIKGYCTLRNEIYSNV
jgi:nucleoside-diphosphate-sugar epimerase